MEMFFIEIQKSVFSLYYLVSGEKKNTKYQLKLSNFKFLTIA